MKRNTTKPIELYVLAILAVALLVTALLALHSPAEGDVKTAIVVQVFTVLVVVVQAIRNIPQGEAMSRMVDHLAASTPVIEPVPPTVPAEPE